MAFNIGRALSGLGSTNRFPQAGAYRNNMFNRNRATTPGVRTEGNSRANYGIMGARTPQSFRSRTGYTAPSNQYQGPQQGGLVSLDPQYQGSLPEQYMSGITRPSFDQGLQQERITTMPFYDQRQFAPAPVQQQGGAQINPYIGMPQPNLVPSTGQSGSNMRIQGGISGPNGSIIYGDDRDQIQPYAPIGMPQPNPVPSYNPEIGQSGSTMRSFNPVPSQLPNRRFDPELEQRYGSGVPFNPVPSQLPPRQNMSRSTGRRNMSRSTNPFANRFF